MSEKNDFWCIHHHYKCKLEYIELKVIKVILIRVIIEKIYLILYWKLKWVLYFKTIKIEKIKVVIKVVTYGCIYHYFLINSLWKC